jgi:hypothetical protein
MMGGGSRRAAIPGGHEGQDGAQRKLRGVVTSNAAR